MKLHPGKFFGAFILCFYLFWSGSVAASNGGSPPEHSAPSEFGGPLVQMEETTYDFGHVNGRNEIEHTFHLKNGGTADLEISDVKVS